MDSRCVLSCAIDVRQSRADPEKWGGAIELAILADALEAEIAALDIQTGAAAPTAHSPFIVPARTAIAQVFGSGKGFKRRAYLLYKCELRARSDDLT